MNGWSRLAAILLAMVSTAAFGAPAGVGVQLSADAQHRLGVSTVKLSPASRAAEIDAFAKVLDPAPLVQLDADLSTAQAAAVASKAEADRATALQATGAGLASKDTEAAIAQARSDAIKVTSLERQLSVQWSPGFAKLTAAQLGALASGLTNGSIALVHVDTHNNEGQAGARTVRIDVGDKSLTGRVIGPARAAEPRLQSSGLIVEVTGKEAVLLSVGLVQSAHISTTKGETGVLIPREAVIRYEGSQWVYVRSGPTSFERRMLEDPTAGDDGYFEPHGFMRGDEIVVQGAAAMFAAEHGAAIKGG